MISIIIPTLNEAEMLADTLAHIHRNEAAHEIIVVDAKSTDGTIEIAEKAKCAVVAGAERHRAKQMNLGAMHAHGEILLFLHADTLIASEALKGMQTAFGNTRVVGGGFRRRFLNATALLRLTCALADLRGRWLGWHLGDQGIFIRRAVFEQLAGFRNLPLFEDLDLCRRLKRVGKVISLGPPVLSSARRFARRGAALTTLTDAWLTLRYLAGVDPARLAGSEQSRISQRAIRPPEASHS